MYLFRRATEDVRVAWSTDGTSQLVLTTSSPLTRVDIMGESTVLQPTNGAIALTVGATPFYLVGPVDAVRELGRNVTVADTIRDFSNTQGSSNGTWYYGNCFVIPGTAYDPNSLTAMTYTRQSFGYEYSSFYSYAKIDANGAHPSARYGYPIVYPVWTVRRWISNVAANARITGKIIRSAIFGDGTGARIYVNGNLVYSTIVGGAGAGATLDFDFTTPIQVGAKVDFAVTPGSAIDIGYDYVDFRAQISVPPPAPATFTSWQEQNFTAAEFIDPAVSGATAAPAGDGVGNLLKYSANASARGFSSSVLPAVNLLRVGNDTFLTLSFRRSTSATDLTFSPEINAGNLSGGPWTAGGVQVGSPVANGDGTLTFTYRDEVPITSAIPRRYMRLKVQRP
jgi:hypothetical protein